ncbi:MAG: putative ABC transporter permease [Bacilli bacterium]|nr:putative ABC transporter permease [Bacilli bacterium]
MFIIYSVIGYIVEVSFVSINEKKLNLSRGYLIGPVIPVFGLGAVLMCLLLQKYENDIIALYVLSTAICTGLEYFTSLLMEKIFRMRWWDYSDEKLNLDGRVCLKFALCFGLGGVIIIKYVQPLISNFLYSFDSKTIYIIAAILFVLFLIDFIVSTNIVMSLRINIHRLTNKDVTHKIKKEVRRRLSSASILTKRLMNAFPDMPKLNKNLNLEAVEDLIFGRKRFPFWKKK